jgi:superfamily II DNA helicase RecQ
MNLVLLSPEIALSDRFKTEVLYNQAFRDHFVLVAIDELHVVSEWGQRWRNSYNRLALLRDQIGNHVPWLGCSATLDPVTLAEVRDLCGFDKAVHIQRTSIDRPDITFEIWAMQHSLSSYRDLEFLVKPVQAAVEQVVKERRENVAREGFKAGGMVAARAALAGTQIRTEAGSDSGVCCRRIPKTVVYVDSIKQIHDMARVLRALLIRTGCSKTSAIDAIQVYHSELAESDKRRISTEFEKPDTESILESSIHRIIIATDAMGMGIDNPDIRLVIQWGVPPSMGALMQRAGRCARGKAVCGEFIWLVPAWCFGERVEHVPSRSAVNKKRLTESERRSALPRGIWELINDSTCIRKGILEFFGEHCAQFTHPSPCCSRCKGDEVKIRITKAGRSVKNVQCQKYITDAVKLALVKWREEKAAAVLSPTVFTTALPEMILPDKAVTIISRTAETVTSLGALERALRGEWGSLESYGSEVLEVTQNACLQAKFEKHKLGK